MTLWLSTDTGLQVAAEKVAKLAQARQQMEQDVAEVLAQEAAQAADSQAQASPARQPQGSETQHAGGEPQQASTELQAAERQGQLLSGVRDFMTMAREGIKQRQAALQYARSTWQVTMLHWKSLANMHSLPHVHQESYNPRPKQARCADEQVSLSFT